MIARLVLENFMAHARTELELGPGVTALTGPNNVGKSAVVEALRCLAQNPAPRHVIRHGAKEARVSVELDDGTRVVWIRKKAGAGYQLWRPGAEAPEEFWKLGRGGVPDEIREALRLETVVLENRDDAIDVHLGDQRRPIFLLDEPPSTAAAFFAASSESAHLLAMQDELKRRTQDARRDQAKATARLSAIEDALDRLSGLPDLDLALAEARDKEELLRRSGEGIPALEDWLSRREDLKRGAEAAARRARVLEPLAVPPAPAPVDRLAALGRDLRAARAARESAQARTTALATLSEPAAPAATARPAGILTELRGLLRQRAAVLARTAALAPLAEAPASVSTLRVAELAQGIRALKAKEKALSGRFATLAGLRESPTVRKADALAELLRRLSESRAAQDAARKASEDCAARLDTLRAEIAARLDAVGVCPTCGAGLELHRFIREDA
ncbi:MAG: AAA family ATPase [Desulfovibrio aminophilus]|uniref:AAA family ATPase n=1 Tax=Desulfovibrio aminophilus TaxID=81425 RepID=UPI0039E914E8